VSAIATRPQAARFRLGRQGGLDRMRFIIPPLARTTLAACLLAALAGCGYQVRQPFDKGIKTVYVPVLRSFSFRKDLNLQLTERLQKEIERRTPYKVVGSPEGADAILEGIINYADKNIAVESPYNLPRHMVALLTIEMKFYDNRPGAPPAPVQSVVVSENAPFYPELGETTNAAYQKVMDKMVAQIVGMMEQPW
jgi:hypothetical protein